MLDAELLRRTILRAMLRPAQLLAVALGKIDDETFRKTVLVLLLFSGLSLIVSVLSIAFR